MHSSREIEDFVETYLCERCVILRSRVLPSVCPHHTKDIGRRLRLKIHSAVAYTKVNSQCGVNQCLRGNY